MSKGVYMWGKKEKSNGIGLSCIWVYVSVLKYFYFFLDMGCWGNQN